MRISRKMKSTTSNFLLNRSKRWGARGDTKRKLIVLVIDLLEDQLNSNRNSSNRYFSNKVWNLSRHSCPLVLLLYCLVDAFVSNRPAPVGAACLSVQSALLFGRLIVIEICKGSSSCSLSSPYFVHLQSSLAWIGSWPLWRWPCPTTTRVSPTPSCSRSAQTGCNQRHSAPQDQVRHCAHGLI